VIEPNSRWWWCLPLLCVVSVLWLLHAELLLTATIPASYDLTGHLLPIAELKYRLLPQGRLHGWSADWFAGFPLYYFYFPLPALIAVALSLVMSLEAAIKVSSVLGLLAFPAGVYALFRALVLPRMQAGIATAVAMTFLLMQSFWFLGGNIASTVAGEFAFSISLALSLFYLATLLRSSGRPTDFVLPGLLLAGVALSHLVTTITIVFVSAVLMLDPAKRRTVLLSWAAAFLLSAFWVLPFLLRHGAMAAVYTQATRSFLEVMPLELWPVIPAAIAGAVVVWRYRPALPLLYLTGAGLLLYLLTGDLVYPGRFLPYWYLGLHMLAGLAIARMMASARRDQTLLIIALIGLPLLFLNVVRGPGYLRLWSEGAYGGLEKRPSWRELDTLFEQLKKHDGRVYWEQAPAQLSALGSRNLAAVTPYVAHGVSVANGLWVESAGVHSQLVDIDSAIARAPRDAQQLARAIVQLQSLGVTRFVALTAATAQIFTRAGLPLQQTSPSYAVFALPGAPLITVEDQPVSISEWSDERVRFSTTSVGKPHVVRMSYFPNWRARGGVIERGENSLMVVTPAQRDVELTFAPTMVETLAMMTSILAAVALAAWVGMRRAKSSLRFRRGVC
jgi:hypothetical protein